jgi:hypothetical protein
LSLFLSFPKRGSGDASPLPAIPSRDQHVEAAAKIHEPVHDCLVRVQITEFLCDFVNGSVAVGASNR